MATNMRGSARRGVLLLIILALLAMFGVVAIGFVIISGQQRRSAEATRRVGEQTDWPEKDLNEAALQVLRGTENPRSVIGPHSLLEDVYGTATVAGYMLNSAPGSTVQAIANGQLISFTANLTTPGMTTPSRFVGCVLTMRQGIAAGKSTRIIGYGNNMLQVVAFDGVPTAAVVSDAASPREFVINSPAFSGTGFGFDPTNPTPPAMNSYADSNGMPFALRPNPTAPSLNFGNPAAPPTLDFPNYLAGITGNPAAPLAANEEYDAVDYQNMLLAMAQPNAPVVTLPALDVPIPSLHRPELIAYWYNLMATNPTAIGLPAWPMGATQDDIWRAIRQPDVYLTGDHNRRERIIALKRKIILRPLTEDHPNFNGSNQASHPDLSTVNFPDLRDYAWESAWQRLTPPWVLPWDVDNDGDGQPDSIWVDLGASVRTRADGRLYKPLFAILCLDLDGRLNLNAHGCLAQANAVYNNNVDLTTYVDASNHARGYYYAPQTGSNIPFWFGGGAQAAALRRGQGYGPAEINLLPLFDPATNYAEYTRLLTGNGAVPGRYSTSNVPGASGEDYLSQNKLFEYWNEALRASAFNLNPNPNWRFGYWKYLYPNSGYMLNAFGSPANFRGEGTVALDLAGRPIYCRMGEDERIVDGNTAGTDQNVDNPYEFNLAKRSGNNAKFSPAELERLLRPFDSDSSSLPDRILRLADSRDTANTNLHNLIVNHRHEITTESWDIPAPAMLLTPTLRQQLFNTYYVPLGGTLCDALKSSLLPTTAMRTGTAGMPNTDRQGVTTLVDLLIVRLAAGMHGGAVPDSAIPGHIAAMLPRLLPLELLSGRKMDINRPFGNGTDNNGNNVVDEPARIVRTAPMAASFQLDTTHLQEVTGELIPQVNGTGTAITNVPFNHCDEIDVNGDGVVNDVDRALVRQLYARQLYVMALLLMNYQPHTSINNDDRNLTRLVAQWAVNVVDFRDRDSIMTPFEYDIDPFHDNSTPMDGNTWDVDGVIDENTGNPYSDDNQAYRGLVWGCERPELLITETLAFHDRRTQNLPADGGEWDPIIANNHDANSDFDQQLRPEGSLFIELFNPSTYLEPKSGEFYSAINGGIDLARMVGQSPVWRVAIYDDATQDSDDYNVAPERSVYFVDAENIDITNDGHRHYPATLPNNAPILPGRYALIGPGRAADEPEPATTYIGFRSGQTTGDGTTRRIVLNPAANTNPDMTDLSRSPAAVLYNTHNDGTSDLPSARVQPPVAVVIDRAIVSNTARDLRLSVSEPMSGYPTSDVAHPFDKENQRYTTPYDRPLDRTENYTLWNNYLRGNGTFPRFRIAHLQRLANPCLPWNQYSNPYRTVDSMPIDLTTFNGVTNTQDPDTQGITPPIAPNHFYSWERGDNTADHNLWTQPQLTTGGTPPNPQANGSLTAVPNHDFNDPLHHTLGYLNYNLTAATGPRDATNGQFYQGDPDGTPFPWMTWNNRPYISQLELLQVPVTNARELLMNQADIVADFANHPFAKRFNITTGAANTYERFNWPFGHLMNLFLSRPVGGTVPNDDLDGVGGPETNIDAYASLHQLLDMVYVPSRFVGTELQGNPQQLAVSTGHLSYPPFHQIPTYREPGRINLNTVFSQDVYRGLLNPQNVAPPLPRPDPPYWNDFMRGVRGYYGQTTHVAIDNQFPTRLENPFRSALGTYLVPQLPVGNQLPALAANLREITPTLLRADNTGNAPLFLNTSANAFNDTDRNAYFRYQELQRLGNLTTTRSNVYAVWVTVGYFEVEPRPNRIRVDGNPWTVEQYKAVYPDGYALGAELGVDTGEVQRHRAFYIFDRSIPVGFQRGYDLNTGNCVLLKRFIE